MKKELWKGYKKSAKRVRKAKVKYIKSLVKIFKYSLLSLDKLQIANEEHLKYLPIIIKNYNESVKCADELIDKYRKYIIE